MAGNTASGDTEPGNTPSGNTASGNPCVRVSRGRFDPANYEAVNRMAIETGEYLVPAIGRLSGLVHYHAAVSREGSMVHVSIWENEADAAQMGSLKEMIVDARAAAEAAGVTFEPIVNHAQVWEIPSTPL